MVFVDLVSKSKIPNTVIPLHTLSNGQLPEIYFGNFPPHAIPGSFKNEISFPIRTEKSN